MSRKGQTPERVHVEFGDGVYGTVSAEQARRLHYRLVETPVDTEEEPEVSEVDTTEDQSAGPTSSDVRQWAAEAGVNCPDRGRIPASVIEAYQKAH